MPLRSFAQRLSRLLGALAAAQAGALPPLPSPAAGCDVLDATLAQPRGGVAELAFRGQCARGGGSFWSSSSRFAKHVEGLERRLSGQLLGTLPWTACLSKGCFALAHEAREERLWRHFLGSAGLPQDLVAQLPPPAPLRATVALVVRTHAGALSELLPLLRSVELFWPYERWPVVVVLDAESAGDWWVGSVMVPRWVRVAFEPEPPHFGEWVEVLHDGSKSRGWQRAAWSQFHFDQYAEEADFIAQIDADAVIHTWVDEELLLDDEGRARVAGATQWLNYKHVVRALDLPDDIEFMASQPMVLRRDHFEATRRFITEKMKAPDFAEAFLRLTHAVLKNSTVSGNTAASIHHLPCHQSAMGSYLWQFHREEYSWHVMWRGPTSSSSTRHWKTDYGCPELKQPELRLQCPQLFVGSHLGAWGSMNIKGFEMGRDPVPAQGGQRYLMMSVEVLLAQLCTIRRALVEVYGPGAAVLADELVNAPGGRGSRSLVPGAPAPDKLCESATATTQAASVMLGLSSLAFWRNDKPAEFCTPLKMLMEQWEYHAARHALLYLTSEKSG